MTPNSPHAQHVHGSTNGMDFHCPDKSADADGNGFVSTEEGLTMYGDIFISLTTTGDTTKASGLAVDRMPMADAQGNLSYDRTIPAADLPTGTIAHLKDLHLVQHGIDANDNGKYDMEGARRVDVRHVRRRQRHPRGGHRPGDVRHGHRRRRRFRAAGGVATGDGSTRRRPPPWLYGRWGLALLGAGAALIARRRARRRR